MSILYLFPFFLEQFLVHYVEIHSLSTCRVTVAELDTFQIKALKCNRRFVSFSIADVIEGTGAWCAFQNLWLLAW